MSGPGSAGPTPPSEAKAPPSGGVATERRLVHLLAVITAASAVTFGMHAAIALVYVVRHANVPVAAAGLTVTVASLVGIGWGVPVGFLTDAFGARAVLAAGALAWAVSTLSLAGVSSVAGFAVVSGLLAAGYQTARTARDAALGAVVAATRVQARARIHVVGNVGMSLGVVLGGGVLQVDRVPVYRAAFVVAAAFLGVAAALATRLPAPAATPFPPSGSASGSPSGPEKSSTKVHGPILHGPVLHGPVLHDRRYLTMCVGNAVLNVHFGIYEAAVPLWVVLETSAPRWTVGALLVLNTVVVVTTQVPIARLAGDLDGAARVLRRSGALFVASFLLLALARDRPAALAVALLVAGIVVYSVGEVLQTAGSWTLSYDLARNNLHGQYQGVFNTAASTGIAFGPVVTSAVLLRFGTGGWLAAGLTLAAAALLTPQATRIRSGPDPAGAPLPSTASP